MPTASTKIAMATAASCYPLAGARRGGVVTVSATISSISA